jgi:trigger factor
MDRAGRRGAGAGDLVSVEITPLDDATSAEPSKPRQYQIVVGEGQALPAVEDAIRTLKPGEAAEFDVELPADADDPAGGTRPHRMHIRTIEVKAPQLPELNDEFAKALGDYADVAALRSRIRGDLEQEAEREAERGVRMQLMQQIIENNPFDLPDSMVTAYLERMMPAREGADAERVQEARTQLRPAAEHALKRMVVMERIAEMEALHATQAEWMGGSTRSQSVRDAPGARSWASSARPAGSRRSSRRSRRKRSSGT